MKFTGWQREQDDPERWTARLGSVLRLEARPGQWVVQDVNGDLIAAGCVPTAGSDQPLDPRKGSTDVAKAVALGVGKTLLGIALANADALEAELRQ